MKYKSNKLDKYYPLFIYWKNNKVFSEVHIHTLIFKVMIMN